MRRREFFRLLGGAAAAWPLAVGAQQANRMPRIGVLLAGEEGDRDLQARLAGLRQGLERLGWSNGRNLRVDYRFGEGQPDRFQPLAKELIALRPDVIVAQTPPVVTAVQRETREIPVVFVDVSDPIGPGFIASLARPGANITGMLSFEAGIVGKWLAMLKEIAPNLSRVMLLGNSKTTAFDYFQRSAAAAAPSLGIELVPRQVTTAADVESATEAIARTSNGGLMILPDSTILVHRERVIALAIQHRLPAVYPTPYLVRAGGLMSYSFDFVHQYRLAASSIDSVLHGTKPGEIPAQAPTKFETVLNLKTAKAVGLTVPSALLVAADEVIE
jgi:putative tryptophan/tyrosine transport system substrate-binding protein